MCEIFESLTSTLKVKGIWKVLDAELKMLNLNVSALHKR